MASFYAHIDITAAGATAPANFATIHDAVAKAAGGFVASDVVRGAAAVHSEVALVLPGDETVVEWQHRGDLIGGRASAAILAALDDIDVTVSPVRVRYQLSESRR